MATAKDVKAALDKWLKKLDKPGVAEEFADYNKTFQFSFPDIKYNMQMVFSGGKAKLVDGINKNAEMSLEVDSQMFLDLCSGAIDPMEAFMSGTLKPKGNMTDLEKLQIFMEDD